MLPHRRAARIAAAVFVAVAVVHLAAQLFAGRDSATDPANGIAGVTQWLLMPLLGTAFALETRPSVSGGRDRLARLVLVGLGLSWLGDAAPDLASGDTAFIVMVGFFLLAQLTYIAAFLPHRATSVLKVRRWWLLGYLAAIVALVIACAPHAGSLLVPVLVYGACLGTMAVLATGVHPLTWIGGALFLGSDGLIALQQFVPGLELPVGGFWVMFTYLLAQSLIVLGVLGRREITDRAAP